MGGTRFADKLAAAPLMKSVTRWPEEETTASVRAAR